MNQKEAYENIAERLAQSISGLSEPRMREVYFFDKIGPMSDEGILEVLHTIISKAAKERGLYGDMLDVFMNRQTIIEHLGEERCKKLADLAEEIEYHHLFAILGKKVKTTIAMEEKEEFPYDYEDITIGERKSYARLRDHDVINRLLRDPEPQVISVLLENPRLTEADVIKLVTRRPNKPEILKCVALSSRWTSSYTIKEAIVRNPYTSTDIAIKILPTLMKQHLKEIIDDGSLPDGITILARTIFNEKRGNTDEYLTLNSKD